MPERVYRESTVLSPVDIFEKTIEVSVLHKPDVKISVYSEGASGILSAEEEKNSRFGKPGEAAKEPEEIMTNEELLLTAQHIEQHRHATYLPDSYYLEGLKRDSGDAN